MVCHSFHFFEITLQCCYIISLNHPTCIPILCFFKFMALFHIFIYLCTHTYFYICEIYICVYIKHIYMYLCVCMHAHSLHSLCNVACMCVFRFDSLVLYNQSVYFSLTFRILFLSFSYFIHWV